MSNQLELTKRGHAQTKCWSERYQYKTDLTAPTNYCKI